MPSPSYRYLLALLPIWLLCLTQSAPAENNTVTRRPLVAVRIADEENSIRSTAQLILSNDRRTLYVLVIGLRATSAQEGPRPQYAHIYLYDVGESAKALQVGDLALGDGQFDPAIFFERDRHLFVGHRSAPTTASAAPRMTIVDVRMPERPVKASEIFAADPSAAFAGMAGDVLAFTSLQSRYLVDISDPRAPKMTDVPGIVVAQSPVPEVEAWRNAASPDFGELMIDRLNDALLSSSVVGLRIWRLSNVDRPTVRRTIPLWSRWARFLAGATAIVTDADHGFDIYAVDPPDFDVTLLRRVYAQAESPDQHKSRFDSLKSISLLEDAGIRVLLGRKPEGISDGERIVMLNNYGFWLTETGQTDTAMDVLQRVIALSPKRAVARLNLGDAARKAAIAAGTYDEKIRLSRVGLQAYERYRRLSGKDAPAAKPFAAFNIGNAPSENVCDYVAAAYNNRQADLIFTDAKNADLTNDGRRMPFESRYEGSLSEGRIETFGKDVSVEDTGPRIDWGIDFIGIAPFRGKYYVVHEIDAGPAAVIEANVGTLCRFRRTLTPNIVNGRGNPVCEQVRRGEKFPEVGKQPLGNDFGSDRTYRGGVEMGEMEGFRFAELLTVSRIDLDHRRRQSVIGHIRFSNSSCVSDGIAFLDGNAVETSRRNDNLLKAQFEFTRCKGGSTTIVRAGNEHLIELRGQLSGSRADQTRALLRMQGEKITTVCRADLVPTYSAVGPDTPLDFH